MNMVLPLLALNSKHLTELNYKDCQMFIQLAQNQEITAAPAEPI
jgi:hypothetical protein